MDILNSEQDELKNPGADSEVSAIHRVSEDQVIIAEYSNGLDMMKEALHDEAPNFDFSPYDRDLKSLTMGDYKYIWDSNGGEQLFDVRADADEKYDIAAQEKSIVLHYRQMLAELTDSQENVPSSESVPLIDDATRDALRALGYQP